LFETKYWLNRCVARKLMDKTQTEALALKLGNIARQLNGFAKFLKGQKQPSKPNKVREEAVQYTTYDSALFSEEEVSWLLSTNEAFSTYHDSDFQSSIFDDTKDQYG